VRAAIRNSGGPRYSRSAAASATELARPAGYRVQHHLTLGPAKGGTRFAANVEIPALAI
jgi:glutamate dehydrogenase/leucine dehydrogenase